MSSPCLSVGSPHFRLPTIWLSEPLRLKVMCKKRQIRTQHPLGGACWPGSPHCTSHVARASGGTQEHTGGGPESR